MERMRSILAFALLGLILLAGLGFGLVMAGVSVVLGIGVALAVRLAAPKAGEEAGPEVEEAEVAPVEAAATA